MPRKRSKCKVNTLEKKFISSGGYGHIFLNDNNNAVKLSTQSLRNEYKTLYLLKDLNFIPKSYCLETIGTQHYLEMDYIKGYTLDKYLEHYYANTYLSINDALKLIIEIVEKISLIHEKEIAHLDIKSNNFIINKGGVYIIDFGNSQPFKGPIDDLIINNQVCPLPELGTRHTPKDKIDIFCLCIMLTKILDYTIKSSMRGKIYSILNKGLNKDPVKRPSAKELLKVLKQL